MLRRLFLALLHFLCNRLQKQQTKNRVTVVIINIYE